jgi:hypothetical protein
MKLSTAALPAVVHTPYEAPPTFMERFNFIADTPVRKHVYRAILY